MHAGEYPYIGIASGYERPGGSPDNTGCLVLWNRQRARLCKILQMNFREHSFHALGCIALPPMRWTRVDGIMLRGRKGLPATRGARTEEYRGAHH
jgi:hypothetical protein